MSPQRLLEVDFLEIQAVHFTCLESNCESTITLKLPCHKFPRHLNCPSCGQKLYDSHNELALQGHLDGLLSALSSWSALNSKKIKATFSLPEKQ
jgi:predicted RNA-binding Zn-ribbon protein involved in translation (DUF1610 family)